MTRRLRTLIAGAALLTCITSSAPGQTLIISDTYDSPNVNSGFVLGEGINSGIIPPVTRLTGTAKDGLRYLKYAGGRNDNRFSVTGGKFTVGRDGTATSTVVLSRDGAAAFDFAPALGTLAATQSAKGKYKIKVKMTHTYATGTPRFSFALSSAPGTAGDWEFGIQLFKTNTSDYAVYKRITRNAGSLSASLNKAITTLPGAYGTEVPVTIEVTDAGYESSTFNSSIRVSLDNEASWIYSTDTDSDLPEADSGTPEPNKWRFNAGTGRFFFFDVAGTSATYDDFSVELLEGAPGSSYVWNGAGANDLWSTPQNWVGGVAPSASSEIAFAGTSRQANVNDIGSGLIVAGMTFSNGGFQILGDTTMYGGVNNPSGVNTIAGNLIWFGNSTKLWTVGEGSQLVLDNVSSVEVGGDHSLSGGGILQIDGQLIIGSSTTVTPLFSISDGEVLVDGGLFSSRGGFRVGVVQSTAFGTKVIVTNNGTFHLTAAAGNLRLGDVTNAFSSLIVDNSTVTMSGGYIAIPYAAGATAEVSQVGGTVSGGIISFNQNGAGLGSYTIRNGVLEAYQIREQTGAGSSAIYFDNATLRPMSGATNGFMAVDTAEILAGGLTLDAQADVTIGEALKGVGSLTNDGNFTVTLTGNNSYAGNTYVKSGKLVLRTGRSFGSALLVNDYATLGVLVNAQDAFVTNSTLALGYGCTLTFELATFANPQTNAMLKIASLSATGPVTLELTKSTLLGLNEGVVPLIDYDGAVGGGVANFTGGTPILPGGVSGYLVHNVAETRIDLVITGVPGFLWTGAVSGIWDKGTENWIDMQTGTPSLFADGYPTHFRDGATTGNVEVDSSFPSPSVMVISNGALPYVFSGASIGFSAPGPLIKKYGPGSFTRTGGFKNSGDFIAGVELNAGLLIVGDETFDVPLTDAAGGTGTLVKTGTGTLFLNSTNASYDGSIQIEAGIVKLGDNDSMGRDGGQVLVQEGTTLDLNDRAPGAKPIVVSGHGTTGQGAIIDTAGGGVGVNLRDVTLAGDTTFGAAEGMRWDLRIRNNTGPGPGLKGNGYNLFKAGPGHVSIASQDNLPPENPNVFWSMNLGDVVVKEGQLTFAELVNPGNPEKSIAVWAGATLSLYNLGVTNPITRAIYATNAALLSAGGSSDFTNVYAGPMTISGSVDYRFENLSMALLNGAISGAGQLNVFGAGGGAASCILHLNGANAYTGPTTITNVILAGGGSIQGNLTILSAATLAPGNPVGTFTVAGNTTIEGTAVMELNGTANYDRLVAGSITFPGKLTVVVLTAQPGVYQLFNHPVSIAPANLTLPALPSGMSWVNKLDQNGSIEIAGQTTPPNISDVSLIGGTFSFSGTGGTEGSGYTVVTSTDLMIPLQSWTPVATGTFGAGGTFSFETNNVPNSKQFFGIRTP